jgi:hypothetical protein
MPGTWQEELHPRSEAGKFAAKAAGDAANRMAALKDKWPKAEFSGDLSSDEINSALQHDRDRNLPYPRRHRTTEEGFPRLGSPRGLRPICLGQMAAVEKEGVRCTTSLMAFTPRGLPPLADAFWPCTTSAQF